MSTCESWHPSEKLEDFVRAQFYCPHALDDSNYAKNARVLLNGVAYTVAIQLTQPPTLSGTENKYQPKC